MTQALGGGYKYESQETRALGSITRESYDYRDQGKLLSKLTSDVSYLAAYSRKMQKGIDDANQNFVQQIQSFIRDIFVLFGGGGDTGLDFGDLKYLLQAIGALLGFDSVGGIPLPINLFQAAWHFFSNYILPVDNFHEVIDMIIDAAIATILDLFGEVPILGQALQQLAVIISNIRDALGPLTDALDEIFGVFDGDWLSGDFGIFEPLWTAVTDFFGVITGPIVLALTPILQVIATWSMPFIESLTYIVQVAASLIKMLTGSMTFDDFTLTNFDPITAVTTMISNFISNGLLGPDSPFSAFNLFGLIPPGLIPFLPVSHIGNDAPELLGESAFGSAGSIAPGGEGWQWDGTTGHTSNGSVKATANAKQLTLVSDPIYSGETQQLDLGMWIKWASAAYTGTNHVTLAINKYTGPTHNDYIGTTAIVNQTFTGANQSTWQHLTGTYTVPAGVTYIRVALKVNSNVTAGNVWFDDVSAKKTGLMQMSWVDGLFDFFNNVVNTLTAVPLGIVSGIVDFWADFANALLGFGAVAVPAYTPQNAAVSNVQAQINVLLSDADPSTVGFFDGFNAPPTISSAWANGFGTMDVVYTDGTFWDDGGYNFKLYDDARPGTDFWQVQASVNYITGHGGSNARILGGIDTTGWTRFPAIELVTTGSGDEVRLVSLLGNPNSVANASIGRLQHDVHVFGFFILKQGDVFALECLEADGIYNLYLNPGPAVMPICTYDDHIANLIPRGAGHRDTGLQINYTNAADPFQGSGWDNFAGFDRIA